MDGQLAAWQTQTLRLTAFPSPSAPIIHPTWWHDLRGEEPESRISQPRKGGLKEEGSFGDGNLILGFEPTRIDWIYTPVNDEKQQSEGFLTIGSLDNTIQLFAPLMDHWFELEACPPVQQLAFGVILLQPVQDWQSGYRQLMHYIPSVQLDVDNTWDFLYQINRQRDSRFFTGLRINRLSKWSVVAIQWQTMSLQMPSAPIRQTLSPLYHACRLELDINTVPEFQGEFSREELTSVFHELIDYAVEIANRGDVL